MKWRYLEESTPENGIRPLREIFVERKELIAKYVPAETQAIHARAVADLKHQRLAANILPVGTKIPEFQLRDHDGKTVSSSALLGKGPLVLCFIRGRWCPFCVGQMEAMNLILPEIEQAGATLVAVSPQTVQQSFFMRDQHKLRFPLLSDAGNNVARQFSLTYRIPDEQKAVYQRAFVNLPFVNGDDSWELPIPATYLPDRDGTVLYASANEDYTDRPEPSDMPDSSSANLSLDATRARAHALQPSFRYTESDVTGHQPLATDHCPYELYLRHQRRHRSSQSPRTRLPMGRHGQGAERHPAATDDRRMPPTRRARKIPHAHRTRPDGRESGSSGRRGRDFGETIQRPRRRSRRQARPVFSRPRSRWR